MRMPLIFIALSVLVGGCGGKDSIAGPGAVTPPVATLLSLGGLVTGAGGAALPGATVLIADGVNAGRTATVDATGNYSFSNVTASSFTLNASASGYTAQNKSVNLTSSQVVSFALVKPNPIFVQAGVGDNVFTMPTYVSRIRIQASPGSACQNFVVYIASRLVVNVILGTCSVADTKTHDGTYLTSGGVVEIKSSSGVSWSFTEVR